MFKILLLKPGSALALAAMLLSIAGCASRGSVPLVGQPLTVLQRQSTTIPSAQRGTIIYAASSIVDIFSGSKHTHIGSITRGVNGPRRLWVDGTGNLYVANNSNVTEYAAGTSSPRCSYPIAHGAPLYVTTDAKGRVYVTASLTSYTSAKSYIYGFAQCGKLIKHYTWPHYGEFVQSAGGVAVDASGNVFVRFSCGLEEFKRGAFTPTPLPLKTCLGVPYDALILDQHHNLIATDFYSIDVIRPPYSSARVLVSGLRFPSDLSLNKAEDRLFVVDHTKGTVKIYQYPSGKLLDEFGLGKGIITASGVAVSPDAVF